MQTVHNNRILLIKQICFLSHSANRTAGHWPALNVQTTAIFINATEMCTISLYLTQMWCMCAVLYTLDLLKLKCHKMNSLSRQQHFVQLFSPKNQTNCCCSATAKTTTTKKLSKPSSARQENTLRRKAHWTNKRKKNEQKKLRFSLTLDGEPWAGRLCIYAESVVGRRSCESWRCCVLSLCLSTNPCAVCVIRMFSLQFNAETIATAEWNIHTQKRNCNKKKRKTKIIRRKFILFFWVVVRLLCCVCLFNFSKLNLHGFQLLH